MPVLEASLAARLEAVLGDRLVGVQPVERGYSSTRRWLVRGRTGTTAFAKIGSTPVAEKNLRREAAVYERLHLPCMPEVLGWDAASPPILVLSDLSGNSWPPPWTTERVDRVIRAIESVHSAKAPLPEYADIHGPSEDWWGRIAADPEPFLRLRVASPEELRDAGGERAWREHGGDRGHALRPAKRQHQLLLHAGVPGGLEPCLHRQRTAGPGSVPARPRGRGRTSSRSRVARAAGRGIMGDRLLRVARLEAAHPDGSWRPRDAAAPPGGGPPLGDARARPGAAGKVRSDGRAGFTNTSEWKQPASFLARGRQA